MDGEGASTACLTGSKISWWHFCLLFLLEVSPLPQGSKDELLVAAKASSNMAPPSGFLSTLLRLHCGSPGNDKPQSLQASAVSTLRIQLQSWPGQHLPFILCMSLSFTQAGPSVPHPLGSPLRASHNHRATLPFNCFSWMHPHASQSAGMCFPKV